MYLSVIIPAYNEEKRLPKTLGEIDKYLKNQNYEYEILVVSDGSKDKTADTARFLSKEIKNLRVIENKENHGKGYVVRQGLLEARGDWRLFMDADNATTVDQIQNFEPFFSGGFDILIGSRDIKGAVLDPPQPLYRRFLGNGFNLLVQAVVGIWGIKDTQCGFKVLSATAVNSIMPKCTIDRWSFDPEILKIGRKMGFKIKEVPVHWKNDLESKVKMTSTIKMALDLFKIRWNLIIGKYR